MKIQPDKLGHLKMGVVIAIITCIIVHTILPQYAAISGLIMATLAGVAKEAKDAYDNHSHRVENPFGPDPHTVEFLDIVYTVIGGGIVYGIWEVLS